MDQHRNQNKSQEEIEHLIRQIINEKIQGYTSEYVCDEGGPSYKEDANGVICIKVPSIQVDEADRMDTKKAGDVVYTKDLLSLEESKRLGCGIMEMKDTTFDWTLNYDEIDYIIEGYLTIIKDGRKVTAGRGEIILIPKGSSIQFCVQGYARFLYVTYPADWNHQ